MKIKKVFYFWASASFICMAVIFLFSAQDAEKSSKLSASVSDGITAVFRQGLPVNETAPYTDDLNMTVRKFAHFFMFSVVGFCVTNAVRQILDSTKYIFLISLACCSFYAATDELHQYFVPGRACMWQDWVIDTSGALLGIGAAFFIVWSIGKIKKRKVKNLL